MKVEVHDKESKCEGSYALNWILKEIIKTLFVFWNHINIRFLQTLINATWVNLMPPKHDLEVAYYLATSIEM
jgi:hypothetical protein